MNLLNILQTAKEIRSTFTDMSTVDAEGAGHFVAMSYILESVMEGQSCTIDQRVVLRLLAIFKIEHKDFLSGTDEQSKDVSERYILEPERKLKEMVERKSIKRSKVARLHDFK